MSDFNTPCRYGAMASQWMARERVVYVASAIVYEMTHGKALKQTRNLLCVKSNKSHRVGVKKWRSFRKYKEQGSHAYLLLAIRCRWR